MKVFHMKNMKNGWFAGSFEPTAFDTDLFEACYRVHPKGEKWDIHYHREATEINVLIKGKMTMQGKELESGDIFIVTPYEISDPVFLEDCEIICIKTPGVLKDKFSVSHIS